MLYLCPSLMIKVFDSSYVNVFDVLILAYYHPLLCKVSEEMFKSSTV